MNLLNFERVFIKVNFGIKGSILSCLVLMREECPQGENNFYVEIDD